MTLDDLRLEEAILSLDESNMTWLAEDSLLFGFFDVDFREPGRKHAVSQPTDSLAQLQLFGISTIYKKKT